MTNLCRHDINPGFCPKCMDDPFGLREENEMLRMEVEALKVILRRDRTAFEQIKRIAGDMLDDIRRAGPRGEVWRCHAVEQEDATKRGDARYDLEGSLSEKATCEDASVTDENERWS